ncbi:ComF family protein [Alteromonas arenosi]|nr:ComF family protein [Alteromonas sp. ASW11-36]
MRWPKVASALKPHSFHRVHAIGDYEYPLAKMITELKFQKRLSCAEALANCFSDSLRGRQHALPQCIIPTPLYPTRYLQRQFNQTVEIAISVADQLELECRLNSLQRVRHTTAQVQLGRDQRLANVADSFSCAVLPSHITHIALFDDVVTTGATMHAMRKAILAANPNLIIEIWAICIALASLD